MEPRARGLTLFLSLGLLFIGPAERPEQALPESPAPPTSNPLSRTGTASAEKATPSPFAARTDLLHYPQPLKDLIAGPIHKRAISLRIEKSRYRLTVLYHGKEIKAYPIVLGFNPTDNKRREGDGRTPEGKFALQALYPHRAWSKFLWLNYPTADSWRRFNAAKRQGQLPPDATIGGEIGIHGVPDHADGAIEACQNWTLGCISLKTQDINEIYAVCQEGTPVTILH